MDRKSTLIDSDKINLTVEISRRMEESIYKDGYDACLRDLGIKNDSPEAATSKGIK